MQGQYCPLGFHPPNLICHQRSPLLHLAFIPFVLLQGLPTAICPPPAASYVYLFFFFFSLLNYCLQYTYVVLIHIPVCYISLLSFKEYLIKAWSAIIVLYMCISLSLLSPLKLSFISVTPLSVFLSSLATSSTFLM